jgi:hypothetical protein
MPNHYFIGLGGTGGNILRELRKGMYLRQNEVEVLGDDFRSEFLYVDSNTEELNGIDNKWRVLGQPVELNERQKLLIRDGDLQEVLGDLGRRPNLKPWLGKETEINALLAGQGGVPGAQQRRRFGRFLFANHASTFCDKLQRGMANMRENGGIEGCTFHLFATLGGGTGSGSIADAILQIRNLFPDENIFKICAYTLIAGDGCDHIDQRGGYFYANQYAALKDINGILIKRFRLHNVSHPLGDWFNSARCGQLLHHCVLISNRNSARPTRNLSKDEQERMVAEWVLQVVIAQGSKKLDPKFTKALTGEDIAPQHPGEPKSLPARSYRFASLGIFRWSVPEEQIRGYLSNYAAIGVVDQLTWNHWNDARGFTNAPLATNAQQFFDTNPLGSFGITTDAITANGASELPTLRVEWANKLRKGVMQQASNAPDPIGTLEAGAERFYKREFRDTGVSVYFQTLANQVDRTAKELVFRIERKLRESWQAGQIGIYDCKRILEMLDANLSNLLDQTASDIPEFRKQSKLADELLSQRRQEWNKVGWLSEKLGKKDKLLKNHLETLVTKYHADTQSEALNYCRSIFAKIREELNTLQGVFSRLHEMLDTLRDRLNSEVNSLDASIKGGDLLGFSEVNREDLETYNKKILIDKAGMDQVATACRNLQTVDIDDFYGLCLKGSDLISSRIERECDHFTSRKANDIARDTRAGLAAIIGKNLLERLYQRFGDSQEALKTEVHKFVDSAVEALMLSANQTKPTFLNGQNMPSMPARIWLIQMPKIPDYTSSSERERMLDFVKTLKEIIEGRAGGVDDVIFSESPSASEMTIISQSYWMAARFADCIKQIKEKYIEKTTGDSDSARVARYLCHLSDDWISTPDLYPEQGDALHKSLKAHLAIAKRLYLIEVTADENLILRFTDEEGVDCGVDIATSEKDLFSSADLELSEIRAKIQSELAKKSRVDLDLILSQEKNDLKSVLEQNGDKISAPAYSAKKAQYDEIATALKGITPAN